MTGQTNIFDFIDDPRDVARPKKECMRILVACEESQEVCKAFRARGHEAFSCDVQECSGGHPEWHIRGDVLKVINGCCEFITADTHTHTQRKAWDMVIAFPPCTDLAVSGARWFGEKQRDFRQQKSCVFFMQMALANAEMVAVENPIGIMSNCWRKPDQIIQPLRRLSDYILGQGLQQKDREVCPAGDQCEGVSASRPV